MRTEIILVTPESAKRWLEHCPYARTINLSRVQRYAADMLAGAWMENGETIRVCSMGGRDVLLNGHHRMHAVILASSVAHHLSWIGAATVALVTFVCGYAIGRAWGPR